MSYDIIIRFPSKEMADEFAGQMSDGWRKGCCDFKVRKQKEGTTGKKPEDYVRIFTETGTPVYFVDDLTEF